MAPEPKLAPSWDARVHVELHVQKGLADIAVARGCHPDELSVGEYEAVLNACLASYHAALVVTGKASGVQPAPRGVFDDEETPTR